MLRNNREAALNVVCACDLNDNEKGGLWCEENYLEISKHQIQHHLALTNLK
jgi:hypothetical protein